MDIPSSPYTTRAVTVRIGEHGAKYTVLQAIVNQYAGLKARLNPTDLDAPIKLPEVDETAAHTLIHFIYTERYQTLGLGSIPNDERARANFERSVLAYCAARLCGIEKLEEVTKERIERFGETLSVFDIQAVVENVSPKLPQNEIWFSEHLHKWIKADLMTNETLLTESHILHVIGRNALFDRAVVKAIAEMYSEKLAEVKKINDFATEVGETTIGPTENEQGKATPWLGVELF